MDNLPKREPAATGSRRRFLTRALLACVFLVAATAAYLLAAPGGRRWIATHAPAFAPPIPVPQSLFGKDLLRVLVVGLDYDYDDKDQETSAHSRSDVIMAIGLDLAARRINELSVPRDMVATMPNGREAKINQAQSEGGIGESKAVVSSWLGIPGFDRYVILRINTMKDLIEALGGVSIDVQNSDALRHRGPNGPLDYDDSWGHLHIHLKPGVQHLSGEQAVGYARFRHDWCSDPCRIARQQQVARAIVVRLKGEGPDIVLHLSAILGVLRKDVETDFSVPEQLSLAYAFRDVSPKDIATAQVPYVHSVLLPGYGDSIVADEGAKARLVRDMLLSPRAASESPSPPRAALP